MRVSARKVSGVLLLVLSALGLILAIVLKVNIGLDLSPAYFSGEELRHVETVLKQIDVMFLILVVAAAAAYVGAVLYGQES